MMKKNIWYTVTKGSDDGTLQVGDTIKLDEDGDLMCIQAQGWIRTHDVEHAMNGAEIEIDKGFLDLRKKKIETELELLKKLASGGDDAKTRR